MARLQERNFVASIFSELWERSTSKSGGDRSILDAARSYGANRPKRTVTVPRIS